MPGWDDILKGSSGDDVIFGGSGDDFLQGRAGNDILDGGEGNDQIHGDAGDDHLRGGAGNDTISGGIHATDGVDTAYYTGSITEYSHTFNGDNLYLNHVRGTRIDGNDSLKHVERLVFADAIIDLRINNAPFAFNDVAATHEDVGTYSSGSASVLDNDFDWEGNALSVTAGTFVGTYGTLVLNANGTYTYTPSASNQSLAQGQSVDGQLHLYRLGRQPDRHRHADHRHRRSQRRAGGQSGLGEHRRKCVRRHQRPRQRHRRRQRRDTDRHRRLGAVRPRHRLGGQQSGAVRTGHRLRLSRRGRERDRADQLFDQRRIRRDRLLDGRRHRHRSQ